MSDLPTALQEIVDDFNAVGERDRLTLLLDFSNGLPPLEARFQGHRELLESVEECQSPLFLAVEVKDDIVHLFFDAPAEAPTTRGFAGILLEGLDGLSPEEVLDIPEDVAHRLGITAAVSPLRLRGMSGMLFRIKRQVRAKSALDRKQRA